MGLVIKVANDSIIKLNDKIETDDGTFTVKKIQFSTNPSDFDNVSLIVE